MISLILQASAVVLLLLLGYLFGRFSEKRHFKRLVEREKNTVHLPVVATKYPPTDRVYQQQLVTGSVVIASDYFKGFLAGLINVFGGRVTPFESMLDRARRESILRMKDAAIEANAAYVFNIKFDTTPIAAGKLAAMEVLAYGTAMIPKDTSSIKTTATDR